MLRRLMMGSGGGPGPGPGPGGHDPDWASVASLLHFDGTDGSTAFLDQTGKTWAANGDACIDTAQSRFGGSSLYIGSNSVVDGVASSDFLLPGSGYFTLEFFFFLPTGSSTRTLFAYDTNASYIKLTGTTTLQITANGSTYFWAGIPAVPVGEWNHFALVGDGTAKVFYVNGAEVGRLGSTRDFGSSTQAPRIGGRDTTTKEPFYMEELRITNGVARYTAAFTPPSEPFPNGL